MAKLIFVKKEQLLTLIKIYEKQLKKIKIQMNEKKFLKNFKKEVEKIMKNFKQE